MIRDEGPMITFKSKEADDLPFDPFPEAAETVEDEPPKRRRGRPKGWRAKTIQEANETPDVAYVIWRDQPDVDGKPWLVVLEATVDPTRALELLELNRGANVEIVELV